MIVREREPLDAKVAGSASTPLCRRRTEPQMHAILITAYKDYPALLRLVRRLDPAFFKLFIHIDRRSRIGPPQIAELRSLGAEVKKTFTVRWGAYTHLQAILHLLGTALKR